MLGGCNAYTAAEAIRHARAAERAGLDGILLTPPPYVVPSRRELVQFYSDVSDATDMPICIYNWPRGCVVDMDVELLDELADIDHVVAIKNSTGDFARFLQGAYALRPQGALLRHADLAPGRRPGRARHRRRPDGRGGVLGADHPDFWRRVAAGDKTGAIALGERDRVIMEAWFNKDFAGNFGSAQAILKTALRLRGVPAGYVRRPAAGTVDRRGRAGARHARRPGHRDRPARRHVIPVQPEIEDRPDRVTTLVVGGGLLGCAVAYLLAAADGEVLLVEQNQLNAQASGQNAGSLHFQLEYRMIENGEAAARKAAEAIPLHLDAERTWRGLEAELGAELGVVQHGGLMVAETAEQVERLGRKIALEQAAGLPTELLDRDAARAAGAVSGRGRRRRGLLRRRGQGRPAALRAGLRPRRDAARARRCTREPACSRCGATAAAGGWASTTALSARPSRSSSPPAHGRAAWRRWRAWSLPVSPVGLTMTATARTAPLIEHLVQHAGRRLSLKQTPEGNVLIGGGWPAALRQSGGLVDLERRPELLLPSLAGNMAARRRWRPPWLGCRCCASGPAPTALVADQLPLIGEVPEARGPVRRHGRLGLHPRPDLCAHPRRPDPRPARGLRRACLRPSTFREPDPCLIAFASMPASPGRRRS